MEPKGDSSPAHDATHWWLPHRRCPATHCPFKALKLHWMVSRKSHHCMSSLSSDAELRNIAQNCVSAVVPKASKSSQRPWFAASPLATGSNARPNTCKAAQLNPWSNHSWDIQDPQPLHPTQCFSKMPCLSSANTWFSSNRCCTWVQHHRLRSWTVNHRWPVKPKTPRAPCVAHQLWEHLIAIDTTILRSLDNTFNPTLYQPENTHFHQTTLNKYKIQQQTPLSEGFLELGIPPHLTVLRFALQRDRHSLPVWPRCDWHGKRNSYKDSGSWHFRVIFKSPKGRNSSAVSIYPKRIIRKDELLCDIKKGWAIQLYNYFTCFPHAVLISIIYK